MDIFLKRLLIALLIVAFLIVPSAYAKKPLKLTNNQMDQVHGAIAPILIVGAIVGTYAIACAVDLISDQYDYFTNNPDGKAMVEKYNKKQVENTVNSAGLNLLPVLKPLTTLKTNYDFYTQNQDDVNKWTKYSGDSEIRIMTKPENIIVGLSGGVGEIAGAAFKGATGTVKLGGEGLSALKPFLLGAGTELYKEGAKTAFKDPAICIIQNNYTLGNETNACVQKKFEEDISDPGTWAGIVYGGMVRSEATNLAKGESTQLNQITKLNPLIEGADKLSSINDKLGEGSIKNNLLYKDLQCVVPADNKNSFYSKLIDKGNPKNPFSLSIVSDDQKMCIAPPPPPPICSINSGNSGSSNNNNNNNNNNNTNPKVTSTPPPSSSLATKPSTSVGVAGPSTISEIQSAAKAGSVNNLSPTAKAALSSRM